MILRKIKLERIRNEKFKKGMGIIDIEKRRIWKRIEMIEEKKGNEEIVLIGEEEKIILMMMIMRKKNEIEDLKIENIRMIERCDIRKKSKEIIEWWRDRRKKIIIIRVEERVEGEMVGMEL